MASISPGTQQVSGVADQSKWGRRGVMVEGPVRSMLLTVYAGRVATSVVRYSDFAVLMVATVLQRGSHFTAASKLAHQRPRRLHWQLRFRQAPEAPLPLVANG